MRTSRVAYYRGAGGVASARLDPSRYQTVEHYFRARRAEAGRHRAGGDERAAIVRRHGGLRAAGRPRHAAGGYLQRRQGALRAEHGKGSARLSGGGHGFGNAAGQVAVARTQYRPAQGVRVAADKTLPLRRRDAGRSLSPGRWATSETRSIRVDCGRADFACSRDCGSTGPALATGKGFGGTTVGFRESDDHDGAGRRVGVVRRSDEAQPGAIRRRRAGEIFAARHVTGVRSDRAAGRVGGRPIALAPAV